MDVEPRYTTDEGFDIGDDFLETLQDLDIRIGIKIARFIADNIEKIKPNSFVSTVMGGLVHDDNNKPVTFALEVIKDKSPHPLLSDIKMVDMDEYLDLLNLNKKTNGFNQGKDS